MKLYAPIFLVFAIVASTSAIAQETNPEILARKLKHTQRIINDRNSDDLLFRCYHVEERINSVFGGQVITYEVPKLEMIYTHNLGKNNTRVVTVKYSKAKVGTSVVIAAPFEEKTTDSHGRPLFDADAKAPIAEEEVALSPEIKVVDTITPAKKQGYALINFTDTYERILMKGYKSVDMLKRVANSRFFDGKFENAALWYSELFKMTSDLDEAFYYRYAQALKSISQIEKSNEMMAIFEQKISKN